MTSAPSATATMPSHAADRGGVEGAAGGATLGGGGLPDGSPGGADGVAGGASGSASDMTSQRYYAAQRAADPGCQFGKQTPGRVSLAVRFEHSEGKGPPNPRCLRA